METNVYNSHIKQLVSKDTIFFHNQYAAIFFFFFCIRRTQSFQHKKNVYATHPALKLQIRLVDKLLIICCMGWFPDNLKKLKPGHRSWQLKISHAQHTSYHFLLLYRVNSFLINQTKSNN
jgi:hypothetical protein